MMFACWCDTNPCSCPPYDTSKLPLCQSAREIVGQKLFDVIRADSRIGNSLTFVSWGTLNDNFKEGWMIAAEKLGIKPYE